MLPVINRTSGILHSILQPLTVHYNFRVAEKHSKFSKVTQKHLSSMYYVLGVATGPKMAQRPMRSPDLHDAVNTQQTSGEGHGGAESSGSWEDCKPDSESGRWGHIGSWSLGCGGELGDVDAPDHSE